MSSQSLGASGGQGDLIIFPERWEIESSVLSVSNGEIHLAAEVLRLWVRPRPVLLRAARNGWSWIVPIGLALLFFYAHFFVMAYLGAPHLDQFLFRGVGGIVLGWFACAGLLWIVSRPAGGWSALAPILTMSAWATLPLTLRHLVQLIYALTTGTGTTAPGLSGLALTPVGGDLGGVVMTLLGYIDLYTLWHLGLLAVIVGLIGQRSPSRSFVVVVGYCVLSIAVGSLLPH